MKLTRWLATAGTLVLAGTTVAQAPNHSTQPAKPAQGSVLGSGAWTGSVLPALPNGNALETGAGPYPRPASAPSPTIPEVSSDPEILNTVGGTCAEPAKLGPTLPQDVRLFMDNTALGRHLQESCCGVRVFGWTDMGYTYSSSGPGFMSIAPQPNRFGDEFNVNQLYLAIEKPLDPKGWSWGFRFDFFGGGDAALLQPARGEFEESPRDRFGFDFRQLYLSAHLPILSEGGVDVKVGRQNSVIGYESFAAPLRPLYSNDYMWAFSEDRVWTGVSANWHVTKQLDIFNAITEGWNTFFTNRSGAPTYLGQVNYWLQPEKETLLTATVLVGPEEFAHVSTSNLRTVVELRVQENWSRYLTQVVQTHLGYEPDVPKVGNSQWYGLMNIFIVHLNGQLDTTFRVEWFDDPQGARTGVRTAYEEATWGFNYHPVNYLDLRPEIRGDFADERAFGNGRDHSQLTLAMDVIMKF